MGARLMKPAKWIGNRQKKKCVESKHPTPFLTMLTVGISLTKVLNRHKELKSKIPVLIEWSEKPMSDARCWESMIIDTDEPAYRLDLWTRM